MLERFASRLFGFWDRLGARLSNPSYRDPHGPERPARNGIAIVVCVLISMILWFTFTMQETYTIVLQMPTEVSNVPDDQALASLPPATARVQVQGEGYQLIQLYYNPPSIPIDARRNQISLEDAVPELPKNVRPLSVSPRTVDLVKEQRVSRRIPIRVGGVFRTPPTHDLIEDPRTIPDSVVVSGAVSIIENLDYWPTERFVVENLRDSTTVSTRLTDTLRALVTRDVESVSVVARAMEFTEARREVDVTVTGAPPGRQVVTLEPASIVVRYRVPIHQYSRSLVAPDFFATVTYDQIRADTTGRLRPDLQLPDNLMLRDVVKTPPLLRYYIRLP
jgi:hypothetical protein